MGVLVFITTGCMSEGVCVYVLVGEKGVELDGGVPSGILLPVFTCSVVLLPSFFSCSVSFRTKSNPSISLFTARNIDSSPMPTDSWKDNTKCQGNRNSVLNFSFNWIDFYNPMSFSGKL